MKVACVHYHFRRGGVTSVVASAARSLKNSGVELVALSGEPPCDGFEPTHAVVQDLAYRNASAGDGGRALAESLQRTARERFGGDPDVWHFHNHSLGKNVDLPGAIRRLLESGARILLQIHDFAEDGRPLNYVRQLQAAGGSSALDQLLYPRAPQVFYATLNRRDASILRQSGAQQDQLHLLPNAVQAPPDVHDADPQSLALPESLILYATRGIRRKNLGEMLLLATLSLNAGGRAIFASTLRPENPEWLAVHRHWELLAAELNLPVRFGLAEQCPFPSLISRAAALLTTSVAEGFGLAFLEPFLVSKPILGRNLPAVTADFSQAGVNLDHLYQELPVPVSSLNATRLRDKFTAALASRAQAYQRPISPQAVRQVLQQLLSKETIDFGRLDEELQTASIRHALRAPDSYVSVESLLKSPSRAIVKQNRLQVQETFSIPAYGKRLLAIYQALAAAPSGPIESLSTGSILDAFLDPALLSLLRT